MNIRNFSSSWADGLAFAALLHHFRPDAFDFATLDPKNRAANLELAFRLAESAFLHSSVRVRESRGGASAGSGRTSCRCWRWRTCW